MPNLFSALPVVILCMGPGVDVRIDADGDLDRPALCRRDLRDKGELRLGFDVEADRCRYRSRRRSRAPSCRRRQRRSCSGRAAGGERPAELALGNHVAPRRPPRRRCGSPTGWSLPSWRSRSACRGRRRPRERRGSGGRGWRSNSNRTACPPPPRCRAGPRPRRGARRRDSGSDSRKYGSKAGNRAGSDCWACWRRWGFRRVPEL